MLVRATAVTTGGAFSLFEELRPLTDTPMHVHAHEDELFYVLDKGKRHMPGQEKRMKEEQKWHLVNFIRSLAKKEAASKEAK